MKPWTGKSESLSARIRHLKTLQARAKLADLAVPVEVLDLDGLLVERTLEGLAARPSPTNAPVDPAP